MVSRKNIIKITLHNRLSGKEIKYNILKVLLLVLLL